jgi:hypothetical protein
MIAIILIVFLAIMFVFAILCNGVRHYNITSNKPGPYTVIIGATHGNEPAGFFALQKYIDNPPEIKSGKITIIPSVNSCGLAINKRHNPIGDYDINRNYSSDTFLNKQIEKMIKEADWVIDLHEGWGFHRLNNQSIGSGVYPGYSKEADKLADILVDKVNETINEDYKKFITFNLPIVKGSLRDYCKNKNYILIETSGIGNVQPLPLRVSQQTLFIENIIKHIYS